VVSGGKDAVEHQPRRPLGRSRHLNGGDIPLMADTQAGE
jgi:hypothetical protein